MTEQDGRMPQAERLPQGSRYYLRDIEEMVQVEAGSIEVYAASMGSKSYRQVFLAELTAGQMVFPAADSFAMTELFIYAKTDISLWRFKQAEAALLLPGGIQELRSGMQTWFRTLVELPRLKFLADRGDDMVLQWRKKDFLASAADATLLWQQFQEHQEILGLLVGMQFQAANKHSDAKIHWREVQSERLLDGAIDHLLNRDSQDRADLVVSADTHLQEAVFIIRRIAIALRMKSEQIQIAAELTKRLGQLEILRRLAQKGGMQMRLVALEGAWYKKDCGVMLGYYGSKKKLAAIVPETPSSYRLITQADPEGVQITEDVAKEIDKDAFVCYGGFPARKLKMIDLLKFMFRQCWKRDYQTILLVSLVAGLIPIFSPMVTQVIFSDIIPILDRKGLAMVTQVMLVVGFSTAAVSLVRNIAVLRISSHLDMTTEAALWNRLLSLPTKFFRQFQTGDLLRRMESINDIKSLVTGEFVGGVFNFLFSFWSLILMCYYSLKLTLVALIVWAVYMLVIAIIYRRVFYLQRNLIMAQNKVAGQVQEIFSGLPKFRVQGAEARAYYLWSKVFGEEWKWNLKLRWQGNYNSIISSIQPFVLSLLLYYMVMYGLTDMVGGVKTRSIGYAEFLAFQAAYGSFNGTLQQMISLVASIFSVKPHLENLRPILEAEPETTEDKIDADVLSGHLEVHHLSFAYHEDTPDVLKDISFHVQAGETLAVVGKSGCGKSTLMRLLLGFETPRTGAVYYDGQDLSELNVASVRSQMGVVLQNGQLMSGDIFTNIVGTSTLTMDDAWLAAERVGIADDIREMPMGMYTMISEGSGNISGGQRQRLLIARALANRPAILLLDEATSALDNRTQAIVTQSLQEMHCTRILVAHRLSTIRDADRILVMDAGRIVESGTYEELIAMGGLFAKLIERQVA